MARPSTEHYDLSDSEKRDLIKLINEGRPLPEKYRFLLFADKREVELVWNGKTREVCTAVLPFQTLEHIDEPRKEKRDDEEFAFDTGGRQVKGWTNKLIWGDNKLILSSLKSGALRRQIEDAGGLKLIYIDPPFDVGADFSMDIEIGGETFHKYGPHHPQTAHPGAARVEGGSKPFRAFEVLNLGRYERQAYLNIGGRLTGKKKEQALARKETEFRELILKAYRAEPLGGGSSVGSVPASGAVSSALAGNPARVTPDSEPANESSVMETQASARARMPAREARALPDSFFHGKNGGRLVVVGPINLPVGRLFIEEVITECRKRGASRVDVLAFEFEMGLFPAVLEEAKRKGIDIAPKTIPPEVFDKRAVEKGQVRFHDVAYVEATPRFDQKIPLAVTVELTDFSVYYSQGLVDAITADLKAGKSEVVCEAGQLVKFSKDKEGIVKREVLTKRWTDWVDYWAVDFDYENRKEIIKVAKSLGVEGELPGVVDTSSGEFIEFEERWTGAFIFENEWQSFRTRKDRELELVSASHTYPKPGRYTVAVKVIDIFGNDTMTLVPVTVG